MKTIIPQFRVKVKAGRVAMSAPEKERYLRYLKDISGDAYLVIRKHYRPRSSRENRYYHGVVLEILRQHFGYTHDEMHEAIKWEFLRVHDEEEGKPPTVRSTASLSTGEWEDLMEDIRQWAAIKHQVDIPVPNEALSQKYNS